MGRLLADRPGRSRLTRPGATLLAVVLIVVVSPPRHADQQVAAVVAGVGLVLLVVGCVVPLVLIRRVTVAASSPRDATVGDEVPITLTVRGGAGLEVRLLDPAGPWHRIGAEPGVLDHRADRRGRFDGIVVEVRTTKPLGVLAAHRLHHLQLPVPVEVGPRPLEVVWHPEAAPVAVGGHPHTADGATGELVRSVRPYVPGDAPRLVHWATTARVGQLVVRELEPPVPIGQAIVVDLRDLGTRTEQAASYAAGACRAVLDRGGALVLSTCEADGPVTAPVRTPVEVGRRLARAVAGPPGNPPSRWPLVEIGR